MPNSQHSNVPRLWEGHPKADVWPRAAGLSLCLASPSLLTCANQKEHSVPEVQVVLAKWCPRVPVLDRNHRSKSEIHWPEILCTKAVCVSNSGGQTFVPGGCLVLYDSLFWNEAFPPTLLPPSFTFRKVRACFYLFSLLFFPSQVFFGKTWHRFLESDSSSDPWRLSSSLLGHGPSFTAPKPILFLALKLHLLQFHAWHPSCSCWKKICCFFSPACCCLVPRVSLLIPFGVPKATLFCIGFLGGSRFKNICLKSMLLEGEEDPVRALGAVCADVSWRAEIGFAFLGLVFATAQQEGFQCPGKSERVGSDKYRSGQY